MGATQVRLAEIGASRRSRLLRDKVCDPLCGGIMPYREAPLSVAKRVPDAGLAVGNMHSTSDVGWAAQRHTAATRPRGRLGTMNPLPPGFVRVSFACLACDEVDVIDLLSG